MPRHSTTTKIETAIAPFVIALLHGQVGAFDAEDVLDLVEAAHRRGLIVKGKPTTKAQRPEAPHQDAPEELPSATTAITAWDEFYGRIAGERSTQLHLLHLLRQGTQKGNYINRVTLSAALGFDGHNGALSLGGVCKAIVKNARACGLDPTHVIEHSSIGYRAGRLVRSNQLPPMPTPEPVEEAAQ